jgi:hypothetical protein
MVKILVSTKNMTPEEWHESERLDTKALKI